MKKYVKCQLLICLSENGEMRYFPSNNRTVSEILTPNGRILVLNISDESVPSTSTGSISAPPSYDTVANIQKAI